MSITCCQLSVADSSPIFAFARALKTYRQNIIILIRDQNSQTIIPLLFLVLLQITNIVSLYVSSPYTKVTAKSCPLCAFQNRNFNSNSAPNDVVITSFLFKCASIMPFIRSLKTTGTQAQCFFITDNHGIKIISAEIKQLCFMCGVSFFYTSLPTNKIPKKSGRWCYANCIRYYLLRQFLTSHEKEFQRILFCDGADIVFQGDPFTSEIEIGKVYFTQEPGLIEDNVYARHWVILAHTEDDAPIEKIIHNGVLNGGIIFGPPDLMIYISQLILNRTDYGMKYCLTKNSTNEQGVLTNLFYSGKIPNSVIIDFNSTKYGSLLKIFKMNKNPQNFTIGNMMSVTNDYFYLIVHQYDRSKEFRQSVLDACPPLFSWKSKRFEVPRSK